MLCGVLMVRRALISLHVHHITLLALRAIWYLLMGIMRRHTRDQGGMEEAGTSPGHRRTTFISDIRYIAAAMAATAHHAAADSDSDPANASPATSPASLCLCLWPDNPVSKSAAAVCCLECGWDQTRAGLVQPSVPRLLPSLCLVMAMVISPAAAAQHDGWMIELQTKVWEDFTIPEKGVILWLKVPTSSFTSRTLLRHYAMLNGWL